MEWVPGDIIGKGSYSTVRLATLKKKNGRFPDIMAVKSSSISHAKMLLHEKSILEKLQDCPHVIRCFGKDYTKENDKKIYNLFLEYADGGTLADKLKKKKGNCGGMEESEVRRYTKCIVEGINYIHEKGYVHRDLKLENVLVCSSKHDQDTVKIADLGLARRRQKGWGKKKKRADEELRGTFLYFSPEAISRNEQEGPADVWAIGCMVVEMISGHELWQPHPGEDAVDLLMRIASVDEMPEIPSGLSDEGRDFLEKILFNKDPAKRWTAKMLLEHPFLANCQDKLAPSSPKGPLDLIDGYESSHSTYLPATTEISSNSNKAKSANRLLTTMTDKFWRFIKCDLHQHEVDVRIGNKKM